MFFSQALQIVDNVCVGNEDRGIFVALLDQWQESLNCGTSFLVLASGI